ncbi:MULTISPECIES: phage baseplate plug family protein [Acetobacter]|uniref:phage baseplate plug family protein n=1 Tax=Acetobacter TaxID=434 RepID=UPI000A38002E|nr:MULTISPECIES: hypothetical protein [Acetobacter]MBS0961133.1 hypothetical protein [Acetobacter thailandicus]MBS0986877.1 hypothetical protein [Acetobacter thailandicus]
MSSEQNTSERLAESLTKASVIPLEAVPAQMLKVSLSGSMMQITLRQRSTGLYADIWLGQTAVLSGVLCQNLTWLVRDQAAGLPGDFTFVDTKGLQNPDSTGLGSRFMLMYYERWPS